MKNATHGIARRCAAVVVAVLGCLALSTSVAHAGLGGSATPTFPDVVTVGDTNVPASIQLTNQNTGAQAGATNTVCNFGDGAPCPAGAPGITLTPSCGLLGLESKCDSAGTDPGVLKVSATGLGKTGTACAGTTFDIAVIEPLTGKLRITPQGGGHVLLAGVNATCEIDFTFDVLKVPAIDQDPAPGVQTVQITDNTQWFSALTNTNRGTSNGMTVLQATPSIATTASANAGLGGQVTDHATVTGRFSPLAGSTVKFSLYGPNDASCASAPVFTSTVAVAADGTATSAGYTPAAAGAYRWIAAYSGDANNAAVTAACNGTNENVSIASATPTIATAASGSVPLGLQISDQATVSGRVNPVPGATVTFKLYPPGDTACTAPPVFTSSVAINADGTATSAPFTPTLPGTYRWVASYSGDANNVAVTAPCNGANENVDVGVSVSPTLATTTSATLLVGGQLVDQATVTGRVNPTPGSTVTFNLYGPNDATCASSAIYTSTVALNGAGSATSGAYTPTAAGVYRWIASYSGDANNNPVSGKCGESTETANVKPVAPSISTVASGNVAFGGQIFDQAVVSGRVNPLPGGSVTFTLFGPDDATCSKPAIFTSAVAINPDGTASSAPYAPSVVGTYRWVASYSGDANNSPAAEACNGANEGVQALGPDLQQSLPATGSRTTGPLALGALFVLTGYLMLIATRRRARVTR